MRSVRVSAFVYVSSLPLVLQLLETLITGQLSLYIYICVCAGCTCAHLPAGGAQIHAWLYHLGHAHWRMHCKCWTEKQLHLLSLHMYILYDTHAIRVVAQLHVLTSDTFLGHIWEQSSQAAELLHIPQSVTETLY